LRSTAYTLTRAQPKKFALLVVVDLGARVKSFGAADALPVTNYFIGTSVTAVDWPPALPNTSTNSGIHLCDPNDTASAWLSEAGTG
jgi:hypothetical protein